MRMSTLDWLILLGVGYLWVTGRLGNVIAAMGITPPAGLGSSTSASSSASSPPPMQTGPVNPVPSNPPNLNTVTPAPPPVPTPDQIAAWARGIGLPQCLGEEFVAQYGRLPQTLDEFVGWGNRTGHRHSDGTWSC